MLLFLFTANKRAKSSEGKINNQQHKPFRNCSSVKRKKRSGKSMKRSAKTLLFFLYKKTATTKL